MKPYIASIDNNGQQVSTFEVQANSLKEARAIASFQKRQEKVKGKLSVHVKR
jgi:hypothetical protein